MWVGVRLATSCLFLLLLSNAEHSIIYGGLSMFVVSPPRSFDLGVFSPYLSRSTCFSILRAFPRVQALMPFFGVVRMRVDARLTFIDIMDFVLHIGGWVVFSKVNTYTVG